MDFFYRFQRFFHSPCPVFSPCFASFLIMFAYFAKPPQSFPPACCCLSELLFFCMTLFWLPVPPDCPTQNFIQLTQDPAAPPPVVCIHPRTLPHIFFVSPPFLRGQLKKDFFCESLPLACPLSHLSRALLQGLNLDLGLCLLNGRHFGPVRANLDE